MAKLRTLRQGGFLYLILDDARTRNALSPEMMAELTAALDVAAFRDKRDASWVEKVERLPEDRT